MFLVEQLERRVADGRKVPLSNNVVIDGPAALDLIDQLRVSVPEEVRQAKRTNADAERILEKAQDEADDIVARAQEQAAFLIEERELTRAAEVRSEEIIAEAHGQADEIRHGAEEYAASVLVKLEGEVVHVLQAIRRGIAMLDERTTTEHDDGALTEDEAGAAPSHAQL
ncbi:MAG: ATPase [Candidatus Limnocylindrales bacterium]